MWDPGRGPGGEKGQGGGAQRRTETLNAECGSVTALRTGSLRSSGKGACRLPGM